MAPRETGNNAYSNFGGDKQRALWYVVVFSGVVNWHQWMTFSVRENRMGEFHSNIKLKTGLIPYWISAVPTKKKKQLETWFETFQHIKENFCFKQDCQQSLPLVCSCRLRSEKT